MRRLALPLVVAALGWVGLSATAQASPRCSDDVMRKAVVRNVAKELGVIDPMPTDWATKWYGIMGAFDDSKRALGSSHATVSRVSHSVHTYAAKTMPKHWLAVTLKRVGGGEAFVKLCAYKVPGKWSSRNPKLFEYKSYKSEGGDMVTIGRDGAFNLDVPTDPGHRYVYLVYIEPTGTLWQSFTYNIWMAAKDR